ncbi:MAG: NADH-quinone oxidoreductase subunit C [Verrucomicrobiota bacterium]|nr:NADH-quinone oxidoreductase subunit C [Limisphaera sp.]MDW8382495.1 NADH-quinone oxidoreductase subunit C [Verrucomicrobiota bacterium]
MTARELALQLQERFADILGPPSEFRGEISLELSDPERIAEVCQVARDVGEFDLLLDITGVDNFDRSPRWLIVYHLYSLRHQHMLRLKTCVPEERSELPTVTGVWPAADWHEREVYDMMGIRFRGHPDLRRILMWEGYPYYPLRKDFPLGGLPSEVPGVAFTEVAPLEGGPFVTASGAPDAIHREPRAKPGGPGD